MYIIHIKINPNPNKVAAGNIARTAWQEYKKLGVEPMIIEIGRLTSNTGNTYTFKLYISKTGHNYLTATPKTGPTWEISLPHASDPFKAVAKACIIFVTIQGEKGAAMFDTAHASSICQEHYEI